MRIQYTVLSHIYIYILKLDNLLTSNLFIYFLHIVALGLLTSHPVALLSPLILKFLIDYALVLWNSLPSDLRHVAHQVTERICYFNKTGRLFQIVGRAATRKARDAVTVFTQCSSISKSELDERNNSSKLFIGM